MHPFISMALRLVALTTGACLTLAGLECVREDSRQVAPYIVVIHRPVPGVLS